MKLNLNEFMELIIKDEEMFEMVMNELEVLSLEKLIKIKEFRPSLELALMKNSDINSVDLTVNSLKKLDKLYNKVNRLIFIKKQNNL